MPSLYPEIRLSALLTFFLLFPHLLDPARPFISHVSLYIFPFHLFHLPPPFQSIVWLIGASTPPACRMAKPPASGKGVAGGLT